MQVHTFENLHLIFNWTSLCFSCYFCYMAHNFCCWLHRTYAFARLSQIQSSIAERANNLSTQTSVSVVCVRENEIKISCILHSIMQPVQWMMHHAPLLPSSSCRTVNSSAAARVFALGSDDIRSRVPRSWYALIINE